MKMTCCGGPTLFPFQLRVLTPGHAETVEDRLRIFLVQKRVRCAATGYESKGGALNHQAEKKSTTLKTYTTRSLSSTLSTQFDFKKFTSQLKPTTSKLLESKTSKPGIKAAWQFVKAFHMLTCQILYLNSWRPAFLPHPRQTFANDFEAVCQQRQRG